MPPLPRPVVVVDDDSDDLELTTTVLRKVAGIARLKTFTSGEDVVAFLEQLTPDHDDFPVAFVLDIKMPCLTGLDLLGWIRDRASFEGVPVIIWSSSDDPADVNRAAELGAQCYVGKYPPVPVVAEIFEAVKTFRGARSDARFFDVQGNLFLGREPLPDIRARPKN